MGLDNYWKESKEKKDVMEIDFDPPLRLTSGMCSVSGSGSFRGNVYYTLIENMTDVNIYNDLTNEEVCEIAEKLEQCDPNVAITDLYGYEYPPDESELMDDEELEEELGEEEPPDRQARNDILLEEFADLVRMFREYADAGAVLVASY